ncbi:MAG: outer membrane lipoprotein-sorting protein [Fidelibacterota bacterium]
MRQHKPLLFALGVWILLPGASPRQSAKDLPTGDDIVARVNEIMSPVSSKAVATQTIQTSSGDSRTFEFEMFSANRGEKTLIRYVKPARIRGQAFLMLNHADDIWAFFPRTQRVRKLASHAKKQKVQGSDFTYEDIGSGEAWIRQFKASNLGETDYQDQPCWKIELKGLPNQDASYEKIVMWVRKKDHFPLYLEYYEPGTTLRKTLIMEDIQVIENIPTARRMVMRNRLDHTETILSLVSVTYSWEPPPGFFSERNLKR